MERTIVYDGARVGDAQAVAIRGQSIAAIGDGVSLARRFPGCEVRRAQGVFLPAALDGHLHLVDYGLSLGEVDLRGADPLEALSRLRQARDALAGGAFLCARGARPAVLEALSGDPSRLDALGPLRIWAQDLHTALTDRDTLRRLGLDRQVPSGGAVDRDSRGRPTGLLREAAAKPLADAASPGADERVQAARRAIAALFRHGVVGAVTFEQREGEAAVAAATDELPFQAFVYRYADTLEDADGPQALSDRAERVGAKYFLDGTLGSRTAWLMEPYADHPSTGMARLDPAAALGEMREASRRGLSLALHAIGDRAAQEALALIRQCAGAGAPHRIEHLQLVPQGFPEAMAQAGVTASMQPCHLEQDIEEAHRAWADRLWRAYPYRALLDAGVRLAFGSDAPVEVPSPDLGVRWATAADAVGGGVRRALTPDEAWLAYTEGVYRSVGRVGGRIAVGERASLALYRQGPEDAEGPLLVLSEGAEVFRAGGQAVGEAAARQ